MRLNGTGPRRVNLCGGMFSQGSPDAGSRQRRIIYLTVLLDGLTRMRQ